MTQDYSGIMVDMYDHLFSYTTEEYHFYRSFLKMVPGPALELACGTGQFMIPLLSQSGEQLIFDITGLDASSAMLQACKQKAADAGIAVNLVCQKMEEMRLDRSFKTLYIPSCSFMHIADYESAQRALERFYMHLDPGGQLLVSLFVGGYQETGREQMFQLEHEGKTILCSREFISYPVSQLRIGYYQFEVFDANRLSVTELHTLTWRMYGMHEFLIMLSQAGFEQISVHGDYSLLPPHENSQTLVFRAIKSQNA